LFHATTPGCKEVLALDCNRVNDTGPLDVKRGAFEIAMAWKGLPLA
jgi:hypothetical protein